jgi:ketosteroid isomerase-like protein
MKSASITACLLASLVTMPTLAFADDSKAHASAAPVQQVSEQAKPAVVVIEQFSSALKTGDLKRAGEVLADDVVILESGGAEHSRDEYLGGHAKHDAAFLKDADVQVMRRTARAEGSLAWVATESELHATDKGQPLILLSTETMVVKKIDAGWRIVHIHWSSQPKR